MRCRRAQRLLISRETDPPAEALARALEQHLDRCHACCTAARVDEWAVAGLTALRGRIPYPIDVRSRVALRLGRLAPLRRHEVATRQLAGAAVVAVLGVVALLVSLASMWPEWRSGLESLPALLGGLFDVAAFAASAVLALIRLPLELASAMSGPAAALVRWLGRLEPVAIVAVSVCYLLMGASMLHVIGRDLRNPAKPRTSRGMKR